MTEIEDDTMHSLSVEGHQLNLEICAAQAEGWWSVVEQVTRRRNRRELRRACIRGFLNGITMQPPRRRDRNPPETRVLNAIRALRGDIAEAREAAR